MRQLRENGHLEDYDKVLEEMKHRDYCDSSRDHSPLQKADDAIVFDTTEKTADEVTEILADRVLELESVDA